MNKIKNIPVKGIHKKPIITDIFYQENNQPKPVVIFCHGYKGYKDWGAWNLIAEEFTNNDLFFVKFNFSHNGGTLEQPIDFPDLEAFGHNNFTKELDDLKSVIDWLLNNDAFKNEINPKNITLIGHSRGGGIVTLKANEDNRVTKVVSWAGVSDFGSRFPDEKSLNKWKETGVSYVTNGRTNQQMPHYYQFYINFKENEKRLHIKSAVKNLSIPYLIIHGINDETVNIKEAKNLHHWSTQSKLVLIENTNHTFDTIQPFTSSQLPNSLKKVANISIDFIKK
ncbi:MAG: alpha/beta fold hydrolase [Bacteroidota bacterium]